jgi:hypothetical protein
MDKIIADAAAHEKLMGKAFLATQEKVFETELDMLNAQEKLAIAKTAVSNTHKQVLQTTSTNNIVVRKFVDAMEQLLEAKEALQAAKIRLANAETAAVVTQQVHAAAIVNLEDLRWRHESALPYFAAEGPVTPPPIAA